MTHSSPPRRSSERPRMPHLARRPWVPEASEGLVQSIAGRTAAASADAVADRIEALIRRNLEIHDRDCFNLNPATNVMNPAAEAALAPGLGSRPSLGWPGDRSEEHTSKLHSQMRHSYAVFCLKTKKKNTTA